MHDDSPPDAEPPSLDPPSADGRHLAEQLAWATAGALRSGDLDAAQHHCDAALALALAEGQDATAASVRTILGRVLHQRGALEQAREALETALEVQRALGSARPIAHTLLELAGVQATEGEIDDAHASYLEALTRFARLSSPTSEALAQVGIASVLHAAGALPQARRHVEVAHGVARQADDAPLQASCLEVLGALHHESSRRRRAQQAYDEAAGLWDRVGDRPGRVRCRIDRIRLNLDEGLDVAAELAQLDDDRAVDRQPWLAGRRDCLRGYALGVAEDRLAYTVLAGAAALLDGHPAWRHLPAIEQGHLDLTRGDLDAAYGRLGAVPSEALRSVQVRLALGSLRRRLGAALQSA